MYLAVHVLGARIFSIPLSCVALPICTCADLYALTIL